MKFCPSSPNFFRSTLKSNWPFWTETFRFAFRDLLTISWPEFFFYQVAWARLIIWLLEGLLIDYLGSNLRSMHCIRHRNFPLFPGVEIFCKSAVSIEFWAILLKLCGSCAFHKFSATRTKVKQRYILKTDFLIFSFFL